MTNSHQPVLLHEVIQHLTIIPNGIYIDATFGRGGHAQAILQHLGEQGLLLVIDKDPTAIAYAKKQAVFQDKRLHIMQASFAELQTLITQQQLVGKINGILMDLGVSSPQLDDAERGFSFLRDGPLDMRMNTNQGISAADWLKTVTQHELADVIKNYGEERFAKRIATAIMRAREQAAITSTKQLAEIVAAAIPKWEKHKHPATRTFQAIRIFINNELAELSTALEQSLEILAVGGKLLTISFHSLEDKLIKQFLYKHERGTDLPSDLPLTQAQLTIRLKRINGAIRANAEEIANNPRARSATLRVMEKLL